MSVPSAHHQLLYFTNGRLYPTGSMGKRASLLQSPPTRGVATLKLSMVQPSDTGTFLCHVNNPPDFDTNGLGMINLTVLGEPGRPLDSQPPRTQLLWGDPTGKHFLLSASDLLLNPPEHNLLPRPE